MNAWRIWQRLLWKELRQDWPVLAVGVLLPLMILPFHEKDGLVHTGIALTSLLVSLWAVERVHEKGVGHGGKSRTLLPVNSATDWLSSFLLPIPVPLLIGIALGTLIDSSNAIPGFDGPVSAIPAMMLFLLVNCILCTTITRVLSFIPAVIAGALWLFCGFDRLAVPDYSRFFLLVGSLLASLLWQACARRQRYPLGRVLAIVSLIGVWFGLSNFVFLRSQRTEEHAKTGIRNHVEGNREIYPWQGYGRTLYSEWQCDVSIVMPHYEWLGTGIEQTLDYHNQRTSEITSRTFTPYVQPLGFIDPTHVVIGQRRKNEDSVRLLVWDIHAKTVRETLRLPIKLELTSDDYAAHCSPDGRYLLITFASAIGNGTDLWLVDLRQWKAAVALPNAPAETFRTDYDRYGYDPSISWGEDYAYLSCVGHLIKINLRTMRGKVIRFLSSDDKVQFDSAQRRDAVSAPAEDHR